MHNYGLISVILPVFNGKRYLSLAIESIISQTYSNWELIIVDDCSQDDSYDIANFYSKKDARIKVIRNPFNMKLPMSLNNGFRIAKGKFYTWTSDDNIYKPFAFEKMIKALQNAPNAVMVYTNVSIIDEYGNILSPCYLRKKDLLLLGNEVGASFLYRASAALKVGEYDPSLFLAEDYDYWIRLSKQGEIICLPNILYYYRVHSNSLTSTKVETVKKQTYKVVKKHFTYFYNIALNNNELFMFFDHVLEISPNELYDRNIRYFFRLNKDYYKYRRIKTIQNKIYKFRLFRLIRLIRLAKEKIIR